MAATGSSVVTAPLDLYPQILRIIGTIAVQSILYGVFIVVILFSTYVVCCKGLKSKADIMMLSIIVIIYATSTTYWLSILTISIMSVQALYHPELMTLQKGEYITSLYIVQIYLPMLNYILSDTIVAWRAWVLWRRNPKIAFLPFVPLIGSYVSAVLSAVYKVKIFESSSKDSLLAAWFLCLATNVTATGLIACKAWRHRRMIKSYLVRGGLRRTPTEKVLGLLIESGALYCVFLVFLITTRFSAMSAAESEIIQDASVQIAGIYPTVIIVLVTLQKTAWDHKPFEDTHLKPLNLLLSLTPRPLPVHHSSVRKQRSGRSEGVIRPGSYRKL